MRQSSQSWGRTPALLSSACALVLSLALWAPGGTSGAPSEGRWSKPQLVAGSLAAKPGVLEFGAGPGRYGVIHWTGGFAKRRGEPVGPLTSVREPGERHFGRPARVVPRRASWASSMAMGAAGHTVIAWHDPHERRIKAIARTPDEDWGEPVTLSGPIPPPPAPYSRLIFPDVSVGPDGGVIVAWNIPLGHPLFDPRQRIEAALRPPGGEFDPPVVVVDDAFRDPYVMSVAIGADLNGVLVLYSECRPFDPDLRLPQEARMIVAGSFEPPTPIPNSECFTMRPGLAVDARGGATALFPGKDVGGRVTWPIRAARRLPGEDFGEALRLNQGHQAGQGKVAMSAGGEAIVGWRRDGRIRRRIMIATDAGDGSFSAGRQVSRGRVLDAVAMGSRGDAVAAIRFGPRLRRLQAAYRPAGGRVGGPEFVAWLRKGIPLAFASAAINPRGKAFVAWSDAKGRGDDKRAKLYVAERRMKN